MVKSRLEWNGLHLTVEGDCKCGKYLHVDSYSPRLMHNHARETVAVYSCPACREVYIVKEGAE